jgi:2-polyprenyl-6-methoxyphenol hydroxylase-like FAD-dependent oxidoreductase
MHAKTVLISGAGIAGPTVAFWLEAAGFEPTLVERAPALRRGGYVVDFWGIGYDIAERMGLASELDRVGYHMRELQIVDGRGRRAGGFGTGVLRELTGGRYVTLGRSDLSALLYDRIKDTTEVIFDDEIVTLDERADHVDVGFRSGTVRRFDTVIGADGLHSNVRNLVFGPEDRFEHQLGYGVAAFQAQGYRPRDDDVYVLHGMPGRMVGRFALRGDRTLFLFVWASVPGMRSVPLDLAIQKSTLREIFRSGHWETGRILDALESAPELYFDRVSQIRMNRWSRGRIALLGDAAFCVSLLAGQGSALAMTAAYVLAGELAAAGGRHEDAFRRYEDLLRTFIETKQRGAAAFASAFAPRTRWGLFLRNQVTKAFRIPGVGRLFLGSDIRDRLQVPDYRWPAAN